MNSTQDNEKKYYCARCFFPIDIEDKIDIEDQNFHRICSMCCICRIIPSSIKMFYGHVFCNECFKNYVLFRFKGVSPGINYNSGWAQWAPGAKPREGNSVTKEEPKSETSDDLPKRSICARCLQIIDQNSKVDIGDQSFHSQCAKCYFCRTTPTSNLKIYYGQVFCDECFQRHILNRNKDNPSEFFKHCFEQWQNNAQFAESMREFMGGNRDATPFVFMMQGSQSPFCRCGTGPQDCFKNDETKKSATRVSAGDESQATWDLSFENRTEVSDIPESSSTLEDLQPNEVIMSAAEKIEKLTKYLHGNWEKSVIKWEKCNGSVESFEQSLNEWKDLQTENCKLKRLDCPKCLWQCGSIYVRGDQMQKKICCGNNFYE